MKVAVCGKGGCGKSTIVTILANELASQGKEVLIIDSDESNYVWLLGKVKCSSCRGKCVIPRQFLAPYSAYFDFAFEISWLQNQRLY